MSKILLAYYGDDFTGSTDALEFITRAGAKAVLFTEPPTTEQLKAFPDLDVYGVAGKTRALSPGEMEKVLLRDMQRHPFKQLILHLDFQRVDENTAIRFNVPLHFLNQEKSPAGKIAGILVLHELNEIEVLCLPRDLPEFIELDLVALEKQLHRSEAR